jgi:hypothetical protein
LFKSRKSQRCPHISGYNSPTGDENAASERLVTWTMTL